MFGHLKYKLIRELNKNLDKLYIIKEHTKDEQFKHFS